MIELIASDEAYAEIFFQYRQDPVTQKYNPLDSSNLEELKARLNRSLSDLSRWNEGKDLMWFMKANDQVVGSISLHKINKQMLTAEIGYGIWPEFRSMGYASKAIKKLCTQVFDQTPLRKLIAYVHEENIASIKVLEKVGFQKEGLLREHYLIQGKPVNEILFGLLK